MNHVFIFTPSFCMKGLCALLRNTTQQYPLLLSFIPHSNCVPHVVTTLTMFEMNISDYTNLHIYSVFTIVKYVPFLSYSYCTFRILTARSKILQYSSYLYYSCSQFMLLDITLFFFTLVDCIFAANCVLRVHVLLTLCFTTVHNATFIDFRSAMAASKPMFICYIKMHTKK